MPYLPTPTLTVMKLGVRVGHPHSRHVWNDPESAAVCEGLAAGIPLRVTLEGEGVNLFQLDVAGAASAGEEEGGAGARQGSVVSGEGVKRRTVGVSPPQRAPSCMIGDRGDGWTFFVAAGFWPYT